MKVSKILNCIKDSNFYRPDEPAENQLGGTIVMVGVSGSTGGIGSSTFSTSCSFILIGFFKETKFTLPLDLRFLLNLFFTIYTAVTGTDSVSVVGTPVTLSGLSGQTD